jgi:galactokinase
MYERRFRAPGRVNLIGGQVDYHEGVVVGIAIDREVVVAVRPRADGRVVARSAELRGTVEVAADGREHPSEVVPAWGRAVAGVVRMLAEHGRVAIGADLGISSTVPLGAGLSSSAAFEVAVALALCDVAELVLPVRELALVAQRAEHAALGVPCGIQDQLTSLAGVAGQAVRIDCRTLELEPLPLPAEVGVVVINSGVARTLEGSPWLARRADSFAVAEKLGLRVLRDARPEQVVDEPRGRHVVSEIARASAFADALRRGDVEALGPLLLDSHRSSRDDMEVSVPELDALVEELVRAGAYGARLTGGGFGGCVVALVPGECAQPIATAAAAAYRDRTQRDPTAWVVTPAAGAGPATG